MRVSKDQATANRDRVVAAASRLLRERGIDGTGVDALMRAAGLTHGGFYKSFASKEALVAEACARAMAENAGAWTDDPGAEGGATLETWVRSYLSPAHCAAPGGGCVFAALATDAGRRDGPLRRVFTDGLAASVDRLSRYFPGSVQRRRKAALSAMAALVGAVVLARATDDEKTRGDLLEATADLVLRSGTG